MRRVTEINTVIREFHQLPEDVRIKYHKRAHEAGHSIVGMILNDSKELFASGKLDTLDKGNVIPLIT